MRHSEEQTARSGRSDGMMDEKLYDEPSNVDAEDGIVVVDGPDDVGVRLTPSAAEETSERLLQGAMKARGQRYFSDEGGDEEG